MSKTESSKDVSRFELGTQSRWAPWAVPWHGRLKRMDQAESAGDVLGLEVVWYAFQGAGQFQVSITNHES